jgi:hypothetical protein
MQNTKFRGGNPRGLTAHFERHGVTMQFKVGSGNACGQWLLKTPQHRPDARCKFASAERFGDVIVGAKIQTANAVFLSCTGREKNDWYAGQITAFANLATDFKAAVSGNHDVQQKEGRRLLARLRQHVVAGNTKADIEPGGLQVMADQVGDVGIVFKNNDVLFQVSFQRLRVTILTASTLED